MAWGSYPPTKRSLDEGWARTNYQVLLRQGPDPTGREHGEYQCLLRSIVTYAHQQASC